MRLAISRCSPSKAARRAARPDGDRGGGLPPGLFKQLPVAWLLSITALFNNIFASTSYPSSWVTAKLFTVFKRDSHALVSDHRGITVINTIAKLYDMVLYDTLDKWFKPHREQGRQPGREGMPAGACSYVHFSS